MKSYKVDYKPRSTFDHEERYFTSYKKALNYIDMKLNGINVIFKNENTWLRKEYFSAVDWSFLLTDKKNVENYEFSHVKENSAYCFNRVYRITIINVE